MVLELNRIGLPGNKTRLLLLRFGKMSLKAIENQGSGNTNYNLFLLSCIPRLQLVPENIFRVVIFMGVR